MGAARISQLVLFCYQQRHYAIAADNNRSAPADTDRLSSRQKLARPDRGSASNMFDGRQASKGQITLCSQPCNTKIHEPRDSKGLANLRIPSKAILKEHSTDEYDMSTNARL